MKVSVAETSGEDIRLRLASLTSSLLFLVVSVIFNNRSGYRRDLQCGRLPNVYLGTIPLGPHPGLGSYHGFLLHRHDNPLAPTQAYAFPRLYTFFL